MVAWVWVMVHGVVWWCGCVVLWLCGCVGVDAWWYFCEWVIQVCVVLMVAWVWVMVYVVMWWCGGVVVWLCGGVVVVDAVRHGGISVSG